MTRRLIGASMAALLATSAMAQQAAPPPPTAGNIPPAANETMAPIPEPFGGDANASDGAPVNVPPAGTLAPRTTSPMDTPTAETPTEGTSAPPPPMTGPDAVPERADGAADAASLSGAADRPGCTPADGPSVSETEPVEGDSSGTAPGGSGSSGWTGGLGGSDIGTSQSEPLPTSTAQAPHPEVAGGLDPISGITAATGPVAPPPPAPDERAATQTAQIDENVRPSGENTPSSESEIVPPAANARNLQQPGADRPAGADPC